MEGRKTRSLDHLFLKDCISFRSDKEGSRGSPWRADGRQEAGSSSINSNSSSSINSNSSSSINSNSSYSINSNSSFWPEQDARERAGHPAKRVARGKKPSALEEGRAAGASGRAPPSAASRRPSRCRPPSRRPAQHVGAFGFICSASGSLSPTLEKKTMTK